MEVVRRTTGTFGLLTYLIMASNLFSNMALAFRSCPMPCLCQMGKNGLLEVTCTQKDLQFVPMLPNNTDKVTIVSRGLLAVEGFAFENSPNISSILLKTPNLENIHKYAFHRLYQLTSLLVYSFKDLVIAPAALETLPSLYLLSLQGNLPRMPTDSLCNNHKLRYLRFSRNAITQIDLPPCVEKWEDLGQFNLGSNLLAEVKGGDFYYLRNVNVWQLNLSQCLLTKLPLDLFKHLPRLTMLDLSNNNIRTLPVGIFQNLTKLSTLKLAYTLLQSLPFQGNEPFIHGLRELDLRGCKSTNVSFGPAFRRAYSLLTLLLDLSHVVEFDEFLFSNLRNSQINVLSLKELHIRNVTPNFLNPLKHLEHLDLSETHLDKNMLASISACAPSSLVELILTNTGLVDLTPKMFGFSFNNSLQHLILSRNQIKSVTSHTFFACSEVSRLDLSRNALELAGLENGSFSGLTSVQHLDLIGNKLFDLPNLQKVGKLQSLMHLNVFQNLIETLTAKSMTGYDQLVSLNLQRNSLRIIKTGVFDTLTHLEYLNLAENKIFKIEDGAFEMLKNLTILQLHRNNLDTLSGHIFLGLHSLQELDLTLNQLSASGQKTFSVVFKSLTNLRILKLGHSNVQVLPKDMFLNNGNLTIIEINGNSISAWDPSLFLPLISLQRLLLGGNKITSLNSTSLMYLPSLKVLDLSGNPLACTCDLLWFKHWLKTGNLYVVNLNDKKGYTCFSPDNMKGVPLVDFSLSPSDCSEHTVFHVLVGLAIAVPLMCAGFALVFRKRWHIRYYIFLMRSRRRQMRDALLNEERFQYDAFVCYHQSALNWIKKELLPEIEYQGGFKLCLHHRDWDVGAYIADNIVDSIDRSRKTLLLINNEFAQSAWCREEFSLAYSRSVEEEHNSMIVVLLDDLKIEQVADKTIRKVLLSRTFLAWRNGASKERKFWKAMRRALRKAEYQGRGVELANAPQGQ